MDISQSRLQLQRGFNFTGTLEVIDCIDYNKNKTVFRKTGLRDTFLSMFPDAIFKEKSIRFFMDTHGKNVIMQIHDVHSLKRFTEAMSSMRYLGIYWDKICDELENTHKIN